MLEVRGLGVSYGKHRALQEASLRVAAGEIVVILGANGAGKSTLLKAIAGICEGHVTGSVLMGEEMILGLPAHRVVEKGIALVPEGRGIFGELTVRENLLLGANPERAREEAGANLERLVGLFPKLRDRAGQVVRTMSGGEQQMVAIGRAMMSNPTILMLDEPSLGLSPLLSKELFQSLRRVRDAGLGILLVEQNARLSLAIADRGYLLENGRILQEAPAERLRSDPAVQAAYLGGAAARAAPPRAASAAPPAPAAAGEAAGTGGEALPEPPRPRPAPLRSLPAGELAGIDIGALVARAAERAAPAPPAGTPGRGPAPAPQARPLPPDHAERLYGALAAIERAAAEARSRGAGARAPLPPLRPSARPEPPRPEPAAQPAAPAPATAAGTDWAMARVARTPLVEVWRRQPGAPAHDRKES